MTALVEELVSTSTGCKLCAYLSLLNPRSKGEWEEALLRPTREVGNTAIAAALGRRGVSLTEASVRRHRAGHSWGRSAIR